MGVLEWVCVETVLAIPGLIEHHLVGFLALGRKLSGAGYSTADLHAFTTLSNEAAVAIENAISYEELLKVNEQLKVASERLLTQERMAAAGQFAAGMAHEIKNPLSAIKTFAEYLPEKYAEPAFREKFFRIVQTEIDRINTIVKELSDFAKPAPLQLQLVSMAELLEDTLSFLPNQYLKQGIEVHKALEENGLVIQADPQQLRQVLLNLLLNSVEAMEGPGTITIATAQRNGYLSISVADTGKGIPKKDLSHVFDPFHTTKEHGTGLGLSVVHSIIREHGGRVHVESTVGQGTTVKITLPTNGRSHGTSSHPNRG